MTSNKFEELCNNISGIKIILHIIAGLAMMMLGDLLVSMLFDLIFQATFLAEMPGWAMVLLRSIGIIMATYGLLFVYVKKVLHGAMTDFRIGKFNIRFVFVVCAFALPLFVILCFIATGGQFFFSGINDKTLAIIARAFSLALKAGIVEEMIFRGYIMKLLETKWNKYIAILLPSFVFGLLHVSSMREFNITSLLLLITAGTAVGVMFSIVTYRSGSIWASSLIHMVWNALMISNILLIYPGSTANNASIFSIALSTDAPIITGGAFGVEASIFSIIGYLLVSLLTVFIIKSRQEKNTGL